MGLHLGGVCKRGREYLSHVLTNALDRRVPVGGVAVNRVVGMGAHPPYGGWDRRNPTGGGGRGCLLRRAPFLRHVHGHFRQRSTEHAQGVLKHVQR